MMGQKPLMLKDFLELDASSESGSGFRCAPRRPPDAATMRCLLDAELGGAAAGGRLLRSRSMRAFTKLSAVVAALKLFPAKKLRRSLSGKRGGAGEGEEEEGMRRRRMVRVRDIVRLGSFAERGAPFEFPSPVVSSCSTWSDSDAASASDFARSSAASSYCGGTKKGSPPPASAAEATAATPICQPGPKEAEVEGLECPSEEEEQLSPVSVMDFPYQGEEGEEEEEEDDEVSAISASFQHSLANIERTRHELLQKIRRFECLAELDPVDLDHSFASGEDLLEPIRHLGSKSTQLQDQLTRSQEEQEQVARRARELFKKLDTSSAWEHRHIKNVILDFLVEGLSKSTNRTLAAWARRRPASEDAVDEERRLLSKASEWVRGRRGAADEEEEQWRWFGAEEEGVALGVEEGVLGSLMEELVLDLLDPPVMISS